MTLIDPKLIPPTPEMVASFLQTLGSDLEPQDFFDYYESKGWKVGSAKMRDWTAAARLAHRTWRRVPALGSPFPVPMTEWERKQKRERLQALREELREITNPGGCAYSVDLTPERQGKASVLREKIAALVKELNA